MTIDPEDMREIKALVEPLYQYSGLDFSDAHACMRLSQDVNKVVQTIYRKYGIRFVNEELMKATGNKMYFQGLAPDLTFCY